MNKPESLLTDTEMHALICGNPSTLGLSIARLKDFIRQVEKAVVAKLVAEQEPVAWAASAALQQDYYLSYGCSTEVFASKEALLNEYDKSEAVPLYAHPAPNSQVNLDSSKHIADASKTVSEGWQPAETAPKEEPFIGDFGHTIPLVALWSGAENKFVAALPEVDVFKGELNDTYFENTWLEAGELNRWMPLPDFGDEV